MASAVPAAAVARSMAATIWKPSDTQAGSGCEGWIGAPYTCLSAYSGNCNCTVQEQYRSGMGRRGVVPEHQYLA